MKKIKIKLNKRRVFVSGKTEQERVYKIESMVNAVRINTGLSEVRHVGEVISEDEAEYLCRDKNTEVFTNV